jgi:HipA-like protein
MKEPRRKQNWLRTLLATFDGVEAARPAQHDSGRELRVYIDTDKGRLHVATMTEEDGEFVFRYSKEFRERTDISPIPGFPDVGDEYRSEVLWPFFQIRIPPINREDVQRVVEKHGIAHDDLFRLLGTLGHRTITTPYDLELVKRGGRSSRPSAPASAH